MATSARAPPGIVPRSMPPNQTLYVRNLPDQIPKEDLKRNLYMLFATYGVILDIIALKTMKMRGQAHVVFRDIDSSTQAMRALQGFEFCGKEMNIQYAKGKSDTVKKLDGTFQLPVKETVPEKTTAAGPEATTSVFGEAPKKAQPVNTGAKRPREEESEEEEDEEAAMDVSDSE